MIDTLAESVRKILLNSRTGTTLTAEQIANIINEREEPSSAQAKVPLTSFGVARALIDYLENQPAPQLEVTVSVKLKKQQATFAIGGHRVNKRAMLEYMKLEKRYARRTEGAGKKTP